MTFVCILFTVNKIWKKKYLHSQSNFSIIWFFNSLSQLFPSVSFGMSRAWLCMQIFHSSLFSYHLSSLILNFSQGCTYSVMKFFLNNWILIYHDFKKSLSIFFNLHTCTCIYWIMILSLPAENGFAVLFSNDQNLCSKAIINGIKAFSHQVPVYLKIYYFVLYLKYEIICE